jgi:hypothetical protein
MELPLILFAAACGLGGYVLASWLTAPPDPVVLEARRGIARLEDMLRQEAPA